MAPTAARSTCRCRHTTIMPARLAPALVMARGHAGVSAPSTDHGNDLAVLALRLPATPHSQPAEIEVEDERRRRVVLALGTTREAGQAAALANGANAIAPAVRICADSLMADVQINRRAACRTPRGGQPVSSTNERGAEVPPVTETASIVSARSSPASCFSAVGGQVAQIGRMPHPVEEESWTARSWTILRALLCLGLLGRIEAAIARHLAAPPLRARDKLFNVHVGLGFDRDESASEAHDPCMQLSRLRPPSQ